MRSLTSQRGNSGHDKLRRNGHKPATSKKRAEQRWAHRARKNARAFRASAVLARSSHVVSFIEEIAHLDSHQPFP
jgi:hypothetical protein